MEEWKQIKGYGNENQIYFISNCGRIKTLRKNGNETIQYGSINNNGYLRVKLTGVKSKIFSMHRLVALYFIPNPQNKPHINHIDSIRHNNNHTNLEWVFPMENTIHAVVNRTHKTQKRIKKFKITNEQIDYIRESNPDGCSYDYISKVIGLNINE